MAMCCIRMKCQWRLNKHCQLHGGIQSVSSRCYKAKHLFRQWTLLHFIKHRTGLLSAKSQSSYVYCSENMQARNRNGTLQCNNVTLVQRGKEDWLECVTSPAAADSITHQQSIAYLHPAHKQQPEQHQRLHKQGNRRYQTSPMLCNHTAHFTADNRLVQRLQSSVCPSLRASAWPVQFAIINGSRLVGPMFPPPNIAPYLSGTVTPT